MLKELIEFCLGNRFIVLAATMLVAVAGLSSALKLPVDAVPDMTNTQVTVITNAGALCPVEVEQYITYPDRSQHRRAAKRFRNPQRVQIRDFGRHGGIP